MNLNGEVKNDNLKYFDSTTVKISEEGNYSLIAYNCRAVVSGGHFTDSTYSEDLGDTIEAEGSFYITMEGKGTLTLLNYSDIQNSLKLYSNKFTVDVEEVFAYVGKLDSLQLGQMSTANSNTSSVLKGKLSNVNIDVKNLYLAGCSGIKEDISDIVANIADEDTLNVLNIHATPIKVKTEALSGKYYMTFLPSNKTSGDIKYFADIVNTTIQISNSCGILLYGRIEDYVARNLSNRRSGYTEKGNTLRLRFRRSLSNITLGDVPITSYIPEGDTDPSYIIFSWPDDYPTGGDITVSSE